MDYSDFLESKAINDPPTGITDVPSLPEFLFPHQRDIVAWALKRGRAAIFAGTGLGKTAMELTWADCVAQFTGKPVLIFAPLAVAQQHAREAKKFGIDARVVAEQSEVQPGINITNYHKMQHFDIPSFGGIVLDESSILKNETGKYRNAIIEACSDVAFRLAATATPAPNDFMELGNHAEFLGVMSYTDMLAMFFAHDGGETQKWRLKGHAEDAFWKWMAQWAVMLREPADLGYPNDGYDLPPLTQLQHTVQIDFSADADAGTLFPVVAHTMQERLAARRSSVAARCELAASITPTDRPFVWWCNLNKESELLAKLIPGAVELRGSDSDAKKEETIKGFLDGSIRVLVSKCSIAGFGLNFQHCADTGFVGLSDSFEQVYQAIRRFWRFGQMRPVTVHFIAAETEGAVVENIKRKEKDADRMAKAMIIHTKDLSKRAVRGMVRDSGEYDPQEAIVIPEYVASAEWACQKNVAT